MPDSVFPGALDTFTQPSHAAGDTLASVPHDLQHRKTNDALLELEKQLVGRAWYNVKAYGAAGDGVADDGAEIQAAIDAAATSGGTVFFPPGTYQVTIPASVNSGAITLKSNVRLHFAAGAVLRADSTGKSAYTGPIVGVGTSTVPATDVAIEGMTLDGQQTANSGAEYVMGINLYTGARRVRIVGCTFRYLAGDGICAGQIASSDASDVVIQGNVFHNITGQAVTAGTTGGGKDWIVSSNGCLTQGATNTNGAEAMAFADIARVTVSGNVVSGWGSVTFANSTDVVIADNVLSPRLGGAGVILTGVSRAAVSGNSIDRKTNVTTDVANQAAIEVNTTCVDLIIANNTILRKDCDRAGILLNATIAGLTIANNTIAGGTVNGPQGNRHPDLFLGPSSVLTDIAVTGNTFKASQSPSIASAAGSTVTRGVVSGNVSTSGGYQVIRSVTKVAFTGNRITSSTSAFAVSGANECIFLLNATDCLVSGNHLESTSGGTCVRIQADSASTGNRVEGNWMSTSGNHVQEVNGGVAPNNNVVGFNMTGTANAAYVLVGAASYVGSKFTNVIMGNRTDGRGIFLDTAAAPAQPRVTLDGENGRIYINPQQVGGLDPANRDAVLVVGGRASVPSIVAQPHSTTPSSIAEFQSAAGAMLSKVDKNGYIMTAKTSAPADADLAAGQVAFWLDATNGAAKMMFKAKQADGTVRSGSVTLT